MTPAGSTFRFVAQHQNNCSTAVAAGKFRASNYSRLIWSTVTNAEKMERVTILESASAVAFPAVIMATTLISPRSVTSNHCDRLVRMKRCSSRVSRKSVGWITTIKQGPSTTYNVLYSFLYFLKCRKMDVIIIADIKSKKNMTRK